MSTSRTAATPGAGRSAKGSSKKNIFARIVLYVRQVIDEMRKVVWPTRHELVQYTAVVLVFVIIVMLYVVGLDEVFKRLMSAIFGA